MPPGSETFIIGFLNAILSQYGALTTFLLLVIYYLQRQLAEERKSHAATTDRLLTSSERASAALTSSAEAMAALRGVIDRVVDRLSYIGPSRNG